MSQGDKVEESIELKNNRGIQGNIYQIPPQKLVTTDNAVAINKIVASELTSYVEVNKLLHDKSTTVEEVAGFVISIVDRAQHILKSLAEKWPTNQRPFLLNATIDYLNLEINKLSDNKEPNLARELFDIIADLRNHLDNINTMFSRKSNNIANFDKTLVCDTFIKSLSSFLLQAKEWSSVHQVSEIHTTQFIGGVKR